jgi:hypothetical protein
LEPGGVQALWVNWILNLYSPPHLGVGHRRRRVVVVEHVVCRDLFAEPRQLRIGSGCVEVGRPSRGVLARPAADGAGGGADAAVRWPVRRRRRRH